MDSAATRAATKIKCKNVPMSELSLEYIHTLNMLRALLFLYLCLGTAQAITWSAPQETLRVEDGLAVVPLPTVSPMLLRRDDSEWSNTCGYRSGGELPRLQFIRST